VIKFVPRSKHNVSVIKTNQLMLYGIVIAAFFLGGGVHTKPVSIPCEEKVEFLSAFAKLQLTFSCPSSACDISAPTGRIFMKFDILIFFENVMGKFKFH